MSERRTGAMSNVVIPAQLRPKDGRFGSGPAKIRPEQLAALAESGAAYLGTSHRQPPVRSLVQRIRSGLAELFSLSADYTVALGNGGTSAFWEMATFGLIREHSQHLSFGEFSARFAALAARAPWLSEPTVVESAPGSHPVPRADPRADAYALTSPTAVERVHEIAASGRYIPDFLSLRIALENSGKDQTYNTPAVGTLFLLADQIEWMLDRGGLSWTTARTARSAAILYTWAEKVAFADPFVADPAQRSQVIGTVDIIGDVTGGLAADDIAAALRANGIVDTESYRKLGRNQLRIGMFPAVDPADVEALTACIDYVAEHLAS